MSETIARNAIIRCINRVVGPRMWETRWRDSGGRYVRLWAVQKPKSFTQNSLLTTVEAIGPDFVADDAHGGALCTIPMRSIPVADLANVLEWLMSADLDRLTWRRTS